MKIRLLALLVAMALLLTGCGMMNVADLLASDSGGDYVRFSDMEYVEPKPEVLEEALADVLSDVEQGVVAVGGGSEVYDEALAALVMLGFAKAASEKTLRQIIKESPAISVEDAVRDALKRL